MLREPAVNGTSELRLGFALSEPTDTLEGSREGAGTIQGSDRSSVRSPSRTGCSRQSSGRKRERGDGKEPRDGTDESEDDGNDDRRSKKLRKGPVSGEPQPRRLKCPFHQRQPEKYQQGSCAGKGFGSMAHLRDHLKRVHSQPLRCVRCWEEMPSHAARTEHLQREEICKICPELKDDRISDQKFENLNFKKAPYMFAKSDEARWRLAYQVLFPKDEEIPSPYEIQTIDARFMNFFAERILEELTNLLAPALKPLIMDIKKRLPAIVEECNSQLFVAQNDTDFRTCSPLPSSKIPNRVSNDYRIIGSDQGWPTTHALSLAEGSMTENCFAALVSSKNAITVAKEAVASSSRPFERIGGFSTSFCLSPGLQNNSGIGYSLQGNAQYNTETIRSGENSMVTPDQSFPAPDAPDTGLLVPGDFSGSDFIAQVEAYLQSPR